MEDKYNLLDKEKSTEEHYVIRHGVTEINEGAFADCDKITSITIPDTVKYIGESAFEGCNGLTSIDIPHSIKVINDLAFSNCFELRTLEIPDSVLYIGLKAFANCTNLSSIIVDKENRNYSSLDGVLYNKEQTTIICVPSDKTGRFEIPEKVTKIGYGAFFCCDGLTSISIPNSITEIDSYAFWGCSLIKNIEIPTSVTKIGCFSFGNCNGLTTIHIPASVSFIDYGTFSRCLGLTVISVDPDNENYLSIDGVLYNKDKKVLLAVPAGIKGELSIHSNVDIINHCALAGCEKLTSVHMPETITFIGVCAFINCKGLTKIEIPSSVLRIDNFAFSSCSNLREIHSHIRLIDCIYLGKNPLIDCDLECNIFVPIGSLYTYKALPAFSEFKNILTE